MLFRRSLLHELITTAVGSLLILVSIVIAQRAGYLLQLAANGALPNDAITTMLGFNMVKFMPMLLSLTLFLSILMTLTRWYRDSEMVVWFSSGLSITSFIRPILSFSIPVVVLISILSLFVMPWATNKGENYKTQLENRDELSAISPGTFKESSNAERVYFIESFDSLGSLVKNIFVQSLHQQKLGIIVAAKGSRYVEKNGDNFLVMNNGTRYQGVRDTKEFSTTSFEKYSVRLETAEVKQKPVQTISKSSKELLENKDNANNAELQWRLAIPISALILAFLAIPLSALDPRSGRSINFVLAIVIYIIYNNMLSIMQAWVAQGKLNASIGLWPVHFAFSAMAVYLFYRRAHQLPIAPKLLTTRWFKIPTKGS